MWRRGVLIAGWWLVIACVFLAPYWHFPYWSFQASTVALISLFALRPRRGGLDRIGLRLGLRQIAVTLALAAGLWAAFRFLLFPAVASDAGLTLSAWPFWRVSAFPFQALNEEMVLGALILFPVARRWRRPVLCSVLLAIVFALLHFALYEYGGLHMRLAPLTLLGLTAVGCVRHAAILLARHVGYAWAIHAAWNVVMFSGSWRLESEDRVLKEPETLDAFVGSPWMVALSLAGAGVLLVVLARRGVNPDT